MNDKPQNCKHCNLIIPESIKNNGFCCSGCEVVYSVLLKNNLSDYYKLRSKETTKGEKAEKSIEKDFSYFDDEKFQERYVKKFPTYAKINFLLSGIHCSACIWLIEKIPNLTTAIYQSQLDYSKNIVNIYYNQQEINPSRIAEILNSLGYFPSEACQLKTEEEEQKRSREFLLKIGVAGVAAGNCMMISTSLYQSEFSGMEDKYRHFLQLISLIIATPAIFYSASPFYKASIAGIKASVLHIDFPISLGIILGFLISTYHTIIKHGYTYFDSLSVLIFFMLVARFLQKNAITKATRKSEQTKTMSDYALLVKDNKIKKTYNYSIKAGDIILVKAEKIIPIDGIVHQGKSKIDLSIITGETEAQIVTEGSLVLAGTKNIERDLLIQASGIYTESRFHRLFEQEIKNISFSKKSNVLSDNLAKYFSPTIIVTAIINAFFWYYNKGTEKSLETTLALLVITCPCAIGLATPLTVINAVTKCFQWGIFVREKDFFEKLSKSTIFVFDKTGTLTEGKFEVRGIFSNLPEQELIQEMSNISFLSSNSKHLLAKALHKKCPVLNCESRISEFSEIPGQGIKGLINEQKYFLGSKQFIEYQKISITADIEKIFLTQTKFGNSIAIAAKEEKFIALIVFGDNIRLGVKEFLDNLRRYSKKILLVSGDNDQTVQYIAQQLNFMKNEYYSQCLPEKKQEIIKNLQSSGIVTMVGDGINDAEALTTADVSIAVSGGIVECLKSADAFISSEIEINLPRIISFSKKTILVLKLILSISLLYNIFGATAAVMGYASPFYAALLMPVSSLTVVILAGTIKFIR